MLKSALDTKFVCYGHLGNVWLFQLDHLTFNIKTVFYFCFSLISSCLSGKLTYFLIGQSWTTNIEVAGPEPLKWISKTAFHREIKEKKKLKREKKSQPKFLPIHRWMVTTFSTKKNQTALASVTCILWIMLPCMNTGNKYLNRCIRTWHFEPQDVTVVMHYWWLIRLDVCLNVWGN